MDKYLIAAINAVTGASILTRKIREQLVQSDTITKKDKSPVTIADLSAQAFICRSLNEQFPDIPIIAEEDSRLLKLPENKLLLEKIGSFLPGRTSEEITQAIDLGNGASSELFWTLDPIDGTRGFLRGDHYAVALALIQNGEIVLGVLGCPHLDYDENNAGTLLYAMHGEGSVACALSMEKSRSINVSVTSQNEKVRFLESVEKEHANHKKQARVIDTFSERKDSVRIDSQVKYALLAQGKAEVYLRFPKPEKPDYSEKIWDHAAGVIIVEEAGGIVTDMDGKDLDFGQGDSLKNNLGVVATNGQYHDLVLEHIN